MTTTITFNVDDTFYQRIVTDYCAFYDYTNRGLQGEAQGDFVNRMIIGQIQAICVSVETAQQNAANAVTLQTTIAALPIAATPVALSAQLATPA